MNIYYRENTGIQTAQERNLDYFQVINMGALFQTSTAFVEVIFFEYLTDAKNGKIPNAHRRIEWQMGANTDITSGLAKLLTFENVTTTSNDIVSFKDAEIK